MFCTNCGCELNEEVRFCSYCGQPVKKENTARSVRMECQDCGGVMNVAEDEQVLECSYCKSKRLIIESDAAKIEQMRRQTYREVEVAKAKMKKERQKSIGSIILKVVIAYFGIQLFMALLGGGAFLFSSLMPFLWR